MDKLSSDLPILASDYDQTIEELRREVESLKYDIERHMNIANEYMRDNERLRKSLIECTDWMEQLRASGDSGFWDWSDDEYTRAMTLLNSNKDSVIPIQNTSTE